MKSVTERAPTEMRGRWWVPGSPDASVFGTLIIRPDGAGRLETHEPISSRWFPDGALGALPAVQGEAEGKPVTLIECEIYAIFGDAGTADILSRAVVLGARVQGKDEPAFSVMNLQLEYLASWAGESSLDLKASNLRQDGEVLPLVTRTTLPSLFAEVGGLNILLRRGYQLSADWTASGIKMTIGDGFAFELRSDRPASIDFLYDYALALQDLAIFVTRGSGAFTSIRLTMHPDRRTDDAEADWPIITLYVRQRTFVEPVRHVGRNEPSFAINSLEFDALMRSWFELRQNFRPVLNIIVTHFIAEGQLVENVVAGMVAAAEQLYRQVGLAEYIVSHSKLKKARQAIRETLNADTDLAPFVEQVLEGLTGRTTLDARLRRLIQELGPVADVLFGDKEGVDRWIHAAKRSRNDIAHSGSTDRYGYASLRSIARAAVALIEFTLLKQLGMSDDALVKLAMRRHDNIAPRIRQHLPAIE
jgi:hypothetical protein